MSKSQVLIDTKAHDFCTRVKLVLYHAPLFLLLTYTHSICQFFGGGSVKFYVDQGIIITQTLTSI